MPRRKTEEDFYDDAYAREQGKQDARRAAQAAKAGGGCGAVVAAAGCLVVLLGFGISVVIYLVGLGADKSQPGSATTRVSTPTSAAPTLPTFPLRSNPEPPPDPKDEPDPKPPEVPNCTLPAKTLLANSKLVLGQLGNKELRAKWVKDGSVRELAADTDTVLVEKDGEFATVRLDGKVWVVETKSVRAKK
ncbi:MAG: hypothetical protein ABGY75_17840 [Gemmataceae bacterium]